MVFVPASAVLVVKFTLGCAVRSCDWSFALNTTDTAEADPGNVYAPVATALFENPVAIAIALIVVVVETAIGVPAVNSVELALGVVPFVV
jgi:hypothetical protein